MPNLYTITTKAEHLGSQLTKGELVSIFYHDLFGYPLNFSDLIRWKAEDKLPIPEPEILIGGQGSYYFLEGREGMVYRRVLRERISAKKLEIARQASRILSLIPTIKLVAVTGSLAMENAGDESDIDLMVVTKKGMMWTTRLMVLGLLAILGIPTRRANDKNQKDKICLNMWLDESDLKWKKNRNIYTAHEIAQIKPLVNKDNTYEKFLSGNRWILKFWPNAVRVTELQSNGVTKNSRPLISVTLYLCNFVTSLAEKLAFRFQYQHMKSKITRETVTPTRALFHPQDWGKVVLDRLNSLS